MSSNHGANASSSRMLRELIGDDGDRPVFLAAVLAVVVAVATFVLAHS